MRMPDESVSRFTGDMPANYQQYFAPVLFDPYAEFVAERVAAAAPRRLLETACGTGIATRAIAARQPTPDRFVATDLNQAMVDYAKGVGTPGVEYVTADMCALPFDDGAFDYVVCQYGLMFPPDRAAAASEARRVLAPGGTWLVLTWGRMERNPTAEIIHGELAAAFPDDPPQFWLTPHSLDDPAVLERLAEAAGFTSSSVETIALSGSSPSPAAAARGLVNGNPTAEQIRMRDPARVGEVEASVARALEARFGQGPIEVPLEALVMTAVA
jgi:SAM-dependent methyltransferase